MVFFSVSRMIRIKMPSNKMKMCVLGIMHKKSHNQLYIYIYIVNGFRENNRNFFVSATFSGKIRIFTPYFIVHNAKRAVFLGFSEKQQCFRLFFVVTVRLSAFLCEIHCNDNGKPKINSVRVQVTRFYNPAPRFFCSRNIVRLPLGFSNAPSRRTFLIFPKINVIIFIES